MCMWIWRRSATPPVWWCPLTSPSTRHMCGTTTSGRTGRSSFR
ncbi:hypothetical protein E2C01_080502 [Portunus trituberculatus]|uniref:Uncharacterized protein n=1 Tax=Portunus trituberculatus TaxID=210409 RepID=A0A5B7ITF7_PORTR|nr:hypothetical protein [Portunus trituberculatus]